MCGIAGIVGSGSAKHVDAVERMTAALAHRGPDGEGIHVAASGRCVFGHRRLAILDPSSLAAQPMCSSDGRFALTYNGEIYNYRSLRDELGDAGESIRSTGDTETLLRLLMSSGAAAVRRLNGMFAFALWDDFEQRLLLARDRFGQKPLYLARAGELLLFASEIRALLASGLVERRLDRAAVEGYFAFGAVESPLTLVKGVRQLPRASTLTVSSMTERIDRYWSPPRDKQERSCRQLQELFIDAVRRHLVSDAPLGLFLSGGIDSSAITAVAAQLSARPVTTLCVAFPDQPEVSEARFARAVADLVHSDHREIPIGGSDLARLLPGALDAMDQPTADAVNTYIVSHAARLAGIKVVLSGLGGDELFGGYPSFRDVPALVRLCRLPSRLRECAAQLLSTLRSADRTVAKLADILASPGDITSVYLARRKIFSSVQVATILGDDRRRWSAAVTPDRLRELRLAAKGRPISDGIAILELDCYMQDMLLRDSDVMGMSQGLEIRVPFLDAELASAVLRLPPNARRPRPFPKWRFTSALEDLLPPGTIKRAKQGFALPFKDWMQRDLRDEVVDGIDALAASGACDGGAAAELWSRFLVRPTQVGWARPWALFILGRYLRRHRLSA